MVRLQCAGAAQLGGRIEIGICEQVPLQLTRVYGCAAGLPERGNAQDVVKVAVGQKDRFDFKPLPCELLIDLSAVVGGIKDDRLLLPFPVQVVKIGACLPSSVRSLYCLNRTDILELAADLLQFFHALDLEADGQRRDAVLARHCVYFQNIDISLGESLGHVV